MRLSIANKKAPRATHAELITNAWMRAYAAARDALVPKTEAAKEFSLSGTPDALLILLVPSVV